MENKKNAFIVIIISPFSWALTVSVRSLSTQRNESDTRRRKIYSQHSTHTRKCVHLGNGMKVVAPRSTAIAVDAVATTTNITISTADTAIDRQQRNDVNTLRVTI